MKLSLVLGLILGAGLSLFTTSAEAQLKAKQGSAVIDIKPITCEVVMRVLSQPTNEAFATLSRSCKATGSVSDLKLNKGVTGKILVISPRKAKFVKTIFENGQPYTSVSSVSLLKFYMKYYKKGNGTFDAAAGHDERIISKAFFIALKSVSGLGKSIAPGQSITPLKGKFSFLKDEPLQEVGSTTTTVYLAD